MQGLCYMTCTNAVEKEGGINSNMLQRRGKIFVWTMVIVCDFCLDLQNSKQATISLDKSIVGVWMLKYIQVIIIILVQKKFFSIKKPKPKTKQNTHTKQTKTKQTKITLNNKPPHHRATSFNLKKCIKSCNQLLCQALRISQTPPHF